MKSPNQAILWEFWRMNRIDAGVRMGAVCVFALLLFTAAERLGGIQAQVIRGIVTLLMLSLSVMSASWMNALDHAGMVYNFRLAFVRPVTSLQIVLIPMMLVVFLAITCYLLPALILRNLWGAPVPIVGPCVLVASQVACFCAAVWSCSTRPRRWVSLVLTASLIAFLFSVFVWRHQSEVPFLLEMGRPEYFDLWLSEILVCVVLFVGAVCITWRSIDRQRHGVSTKPWPKMFRKSKPVSVSTAEIGISETGRRFSGPVAAQFWYEVRQVGPNALRLGIVLPLLLFAFLVPVAWIDTKWQYASHVWLVAMLACPVLFQFVGADSALGLLNRNGAVYLSSFDATRPMACDALIAIKLLAIAFSSLVNSFWCIVLGTVYLGFKGDWQVFQSAHALMGEIPGYWWAVVGLNLMMAYLGSTSGLLAFGLVIPLAGRWVVGLSGFLFFHVLLFIWDSHRGWQLSLLWHSYGYLVAVSIPAICIWAQWKVLRRGVVRWNYWIATLVLWAIYIASTWAVYDKVRAQVFAEVPLVGLLLLCSSLCLPLAATMGAPLVLSAHRHA